MRAPRSAHIAAIALALPLWAAALIVTILSLAGAAGAADPIPRLMRNLHVDAETLKMVLVKDCSRIRLVMRDRASVVRLRSFCFMRPLDAALHLIFRE